MNQQHYHSYKLLFSEPEIIIDLLQGFVDEPWIDELDFSTLDRLPAATSPTTCVIVKMM